ncbi:hypothetical protein PCL_01260 [Purpureocillium lilacinum]|uniref:Uncharacterized protein n=1 Tax=Purpureocillium lilacinum TaxID=33203 RepID=A0A2U3E2Y3_PURLI|nr:hypothetical protein PCL_01260 [Purpureocillium lilacinum]
MERRAGGQSGSRKGEGVRPRTQRARVWWPPWACSVTPHRQADQAATLAVRLPRLDPACMDVVGRVALATDGRAGADAGMALGRIAAPGALQAAQSAETGMLAACGQNWARAVAGGRWQVQSLPGDLPWGLPAPGLGVRVTPAACAVASPVAGAMMRLSSSALRVAKTPNAVTGLLVGRGQERPPHSSSPFPCPLFFLSGAARRKFARNVRAVIVVGHRAHSTAEAGIARSWYLRHANVHATLPSTRTSTHPVIDTCGPLTQRALPSTPHPRPTAAPLPGRLVDLPPGCLIAMEVCPAHLRLRRRPWPVVRTPQPTSIAGPHPALSHAPTKACSAPDSKRCMAQVG